ncbi:hypothetical protein [Bradyrhizobium liaoningense]|uniref:hypothetical protein n=1 Tax=Bradyrhizobium liaoningense TaxID=43992 RepID=UPI0004B168E5|nr:hypothetical protein [Bradyrhizobium liaoningense]
MLVNRTARVEAVLAAAVANAATFDIAYPAGTSQKTFNAGLAGPGSYVMLNDNEKWTEAAGKIAVSYGASLITVTNNSGYTWAAGTRVILGADIQDGNEILLMQIPVDLVSVVGAGDVMTDIRPGVYGTIEYWELVITKPVTTAAKAASFNLEIDTTNVTGGVIALTSANATPLGKSVPGAAITGANALTPESTLSIESSAVTAFAEGQGFFNIRIRKTPSNAF